MFFSVGYQWNETGSLHFGVYVERNRGVFSFGYRSNGTVRYSVLGNSQFEQTGLQCVLPVECKMEDFNVGTVGIEQLDLQCGLPVE